VVVETATDAVDLTDEPTSATAADDSSAAPEAPAPGSGRLLLGDVVDLAEQVARELGVALPPPDGVLAAPVESELPAVVDDAPLFRRTQQRLPGLADLHAALGSPEVSRVLDDRTEPARGDTSRPEPSAFAAAPPAPGSLAPGLSAHPLPFEPADRASVSAVAGDAATSISATSGVIDLTDATLASEVDLRDSGARAPGPFVGSTGGDPLSIGQSAAHVRLHGRGGSDGGSIL
jgi:hypothetical protein